MFSENLLPWLHTASYRYGNLIELVVTLAYNILMFSFLPFLNEHACQRIASF